MIAFFSRLFRRSRATEPGWIDVADLHRRLESGDPVVLVDVRQPEEFTASPGHLPGAVNIPLDTLSGHIRTLSGSGQPIVLVCKTDRRSARAAAELRAAGVPGVTVLRGGTDAWHLRGLPLD